MKIKKQILQQEFGFLTVYHLLFAGGSQKKPEVASDQIETQPMDVLTLLPPPEPVNLISPEHSAAAKREVFHARGCVKEPKVSEKEVAAEVRKPVATPQQKVYVQPVALPHEQKTNEFTESDEARIYTMHDACMMHIFVETKSHVGE